MLQHRNKLHSISFQGTLVKCAVVPAACKSVELMHDDRFKISGSRICYHSLKILTAVVGSGLCPVYIFCYYFIAVILGELYRPELSVYTLVTLIVA